MPRADSTAASRAKLSASSPAFSRLPTNVLGQVVPDLG